MNGLYIRESQKPLFDMSLSDVPGNDSLWVKRRGHLVWKKFQPIGVANRQLWGTQEKWLAQIKARAEASRLFDARSYGFRINPVIYFDEYRLLWATPWIEGVRSSHEDVTYVLRKMYHHGIHIFNDIDERNLMIDRRFGGLVLIDYLIDQNRWADWLENRLHSGSRHIGLQVGHYEHPANDRQLPGVIRRPVMCHFNPK